MPSLKRYYPTVKRSGPSKRAKYTKRITTNRRKNVRRTRKGRRGTKRGGRRGNPSYAPKVSSNLPIAKYNVQTYSVQLADQFVMPPGTGTVGSTDSFGKQCIYGAVGMGLLQGTNPQFQPLMSIEHIGYIASLIQGEQTNNSGLQSPEVRVHLMNCWSSSDLVNMTTSDIKITAYRCMFRKDVPYNSASNYFNIYNMLGNGFFRRAIGTNPYGTNEGLRMAELTPYDSHLFCSWVKIMGQRSRVLRPGDTATYKCSNKYTCINWNHYYTETAANQNPVQGQRDVARRKGEQFWLYKFEGVPANSATNTGQMTYTLPKIDMITKFHYNYAQVNPAPPIATRTVLGYVGVANTDISIINDDSGLKTKQETA